MSDQNPSKSQTSRSTADPKDELSEEVFAWVVTDTSNLPNVQGEGAHATTDGVEQGASGSGNRQLMVSAPALARHMGVDLSELHSEPGRPGAEAGSDWLASSGLAPLPSAHLQTSGAGHPNFTHALPGIGTDQNVGHAIIPNVSAGGGRQASGQTPSHIVTGGQPSGPAIAGFIPGGKEGHPVPVLLSVVNGNNTQGGSTVTISGLPPGTIMNQGHAGPGGTWILSPGTDLKNLTMTPPTDWFGSGHLTAKVVDPNGHSAQVQLPFNVLPQPDAARISGTDTGTTSEDHVLTVSGALTIVDPDPGEAHFQPISLTGSFGSLQIDASGNWTYRLDNASPSVQALVSGQSERETFTIHSVDGTSHQLVVNVMGTDDKAAISGTAVGAVTEDKLTSTGGKLDVTDPDAGQASFVPQTGAAGAHGSFTVQPDGTWSYTLDNGQPAVQALKTGEQLTDTLTVSTVDGTTKQITVTINGTDDKAIIGGVDTGDVTENTAGVDKSPDQHQPGIGVIGTETLKASGKLTIIDPDSGEAVFDTHGLGFNYHGTFGDLHLRADGTWFYSADAGNARFYDGRPTTRGTAIDQLGEGQTLTDKITVHSKDGTPHDIVITIHGSNDRPYCGSEVVLRPGTEDTRQTITAAQLLQNTVDVDANDAGKLDITNLRPDHGSIRDNGDGTFTFTPEKDYSGKVHFTYDVKDAHGGVTHTGATTTLAAVGDPAVITDASIPSVTEDSGYINTHYELQVYGKLDISDPDPGEAQFDINKGPQTYAGIGYDTKLGGHVLLQRDGNFIYYLDNRLTAVQQLGAGQTVKDLVTIRSVDGTTHQIEITVHGTNDKPVLSAATASATEGGQSVTGQMSATDVDTGDTQTYSLGQAAPAGFALNSDGSWTFDPTDAAYKHLAAGATQQVTIPITVTDSAKGTDTENLVITVTGTNDAAVISGVDTGSLTEDKLTSRHSQRLTVSGALSITDPDGAGQSHFQFSPFGEHAISDPFGGNLHISRAGGWQYEVDNTNAAVQHLAAGQTGKAVYEVHSADGTSHQIEITIQGTNDAPVLTAATTTATEDGSTVTGQMSATDVDTGDTQKYTIARQVAGFTMNTDGSWSFDPTDAAYQSLAQGARQQIKIPVTVTDKLGATDTENLVITLTGTDDKPTFTGATTGTVTEDKLSPSGKLETPWHNTDVTDPDSGQGRVVAIEVGGVVHQLPAGFASTYQSTYGSFHTTHGTDGHDKWMYFADNANPAIQGLKTGEQLQDGAALITADGTRVPLTVTIQGHEDSVVIDTPGSRVSPLGEVVEDTKTHVNGSLQAHDVDNHDSVSFTAQTTTNAYGTFTVNAVGQWSFVLNNSAVQSLRVGQSHAMGFDIEAVSTDGSKATEHVQINVLGTNDAPVLSAARASATEDGRTVTGQMSATDVDTGDTQKFSLGQAAPAGFTLNQDGSWSFDPTDAAYQHLAVGRTEQVTIPITVTDGKDSDTRNLVITVTGTNDRPTVSGPVTLPGGKEDKPVQITVAQLLEHATDIDTGDQLSVTGLSASHGTLSGDATHGFTFTPDSNYNGPVKLTYTVTDGHGGTVAQSATLTLGATPDAAVITGVDSGHVKEDTTPATSGKLDIADPDGGIAAFVPVSNGQATHNAGTFSIDADGNWTFVLNPAWQSLHEGEIVTDSFEVRGIDGTTHRVGITIEGTADIPKITGDATGVVVEDTTTVARGTLDVHDPDWGQSGTVRTNYGQPKPSDGGFGAYEIDNDGHWTYRVDQTNDKVQALAEGDTLTDSFTISTLDGTKQRVQITIAGTNDAPVVTQGDLGATQPGAGKTISPADLLTAVHATDIDTSDHLSISNVQVDPQYGSFHQSGGNWVFTPAAGASHTDVPVTISVTDGHTTSTASASLDVTAAPTPPKATQVHGTGTTHLSGTLTGGSGGWSIDNGRGQGVLSLQGHYGTLTINPQTGHFDYHYQADSAVIKHGGSGATSGRHTDTFHILQHGTYISDADVQVNINVQSVHGHSGHHVDHTTLLGIDIVPVAPTQHDAPGDDGPNFEVTLDFDPLDPTVGTFGLSDVDDGSVSERVEVANATEQRDSLGSETSTGHPGEDATASGHGDKVAPYLEAIGAGAEADGISGAFDAGHDNPYTAALGVDATLPTDDPAVDPSMLDDPMTADDQGSDGASDQPEADVPPDEPSVPMPEDDDPTSNPG